MRAITAYAIVSKKNPKIRLLDVYDPRDIKETRYDRKTERVIRVSISAHGKR